MQNPLCRWGGRGLVYILDENVKISSKQPRRSSTHSYTAPSIGLTIRRNPHFGSCHHPYETNLRSCRFPFPWRPHSALGKTVLTPQHLGDGPNLVVVVGVGVDRLPAAVAAGPRARLLHNVQRLATAGGDQCCKYRWYTNTQWWSSELF